MALGKSETAYFQRHYKDVTVFDTSSEEFRKTLLDATGLTEEVQEVIMHFVKTAEDDDWIAAAYDFIDYLKARNVKIDNLKPNDALHYLTQMSKRKRH